MDGSAPDASDRPEDLDREDPLWPTFVGWLAAAQLPVDDLLDDPAKYFVLRAEDGQPTAFGGLSGAGAELLVRSLVVDPALRRCGLGGRLLSCLDAEARAGGAERLWLLTTDSASWFEARGWRRADRSQAPPAITITGQFARVCPASAVLMVRDLRG